jgi:hypothetical protein
MPAGFVLIRGVEREARGRGFSGHLATTKTDPSFTQRPINSARKPAAQNSLGSLPNNAL